jgi:hypothetical protein
VLQVGRRLRCTLPYGRPLSWIASDLEVSVTLPAAIGHPNKLKGRVGRLMVASGFRGRVRRKHRVTTDSERIGCGTRGFRTRRSVDVRWVRCPCCALDLLVAFSCRSRGFCPSCGGRRMAELAAHLVDAVIPDVPTRQWVLTMPIALRLHLAADADLCRDVASAYIDAVFASYVRGARAAGLLDAPGSFAHPGAVNLMQRFGSSLGINVHAHLLALDGVYVTDRPGGVPTFHAAPTLTDIEVARVHHDARQRIERVLRARGLLREPGDEPAPVKGADESLLPFLQAASAQSRVAGGPDSGRRSAGRAARGDRAPARSAADRWGVPPARGCSKLRGCCGACGPRNRRKFMAPRAAAGGTSERPARTLSSSALRGAACHGSESRGTGVRNSGSSRS